ncbi:MAG: hypothetical protein JW763_08030 [candidate division Zixibacteria bacterium]|nr:hypothetical protein [candidate division Zixibacteria bacterium]
MGGFFTRQGIKQASILIAVVTVSSQLLGVVREAIIANFFGTSQEYDIILLALAIPLMVGGLFFQAIPAAGIPSLQGYAGRKGVLRSPFVGINNILILGISAIVFLVLPLFRGLLAEGLDNAAADKVILFGRIFCLIIPLRAYEAMFRALLHLRHHFLFPAIAILGFNLCTIVILFMLFPSLASAAYVIAWLAGVLVQTLLVMIPTVVMYRRAEHGDGKADGFNRSGYLQYLGTIILIEAIGLLNDPFDRFLCGVYLDPGYVSAAHYANIINLVPVRVFMYSLATAVFPTFSERAAGHNKAGLAVLYHKALAMGVLMLAPVTAFFLLFRQEIIGILFERGAFVAQSRVMTSEILAYFAAGMFFIAVFYIQSRVYYALKSWKMLFVVRPLTMGIKVLIGFYLIGDNWAMAVGGGTVVMFVVSFLLLELFLIVRIGLKYTADDFHLLGKAIIGAAVTVLLFIVVQWFGVSVLGIDGFGLMFLAGVVGFGGLAVLDQVFGISGIRLFKAKRG